LAVVLRWSEARAAGREAVGVDISALAEFVSNVKRTIYSEQELDTLNAWARRVAGYYKHLNHNSRWRLRKVIKQGIASAIAPSTPRLELLADAQCSGPRNGP